MIEQRVRDFIAGRKLLDEGSQVLVGLSGGADSVALLRILLRLGYRCIAVHCNFHLRGEESERDRQFVTDLCRKLGVRLEICSYNTRAYASAHKLSIEMAARELRYADFERLRIETGAKAVCIAHHRDDSVETVLMNLIRGTGLKGLAGIRPRNGYIVRPLLCVSRQDIEAYLAGLGQDYVTDSTNLETDFTRNKVRLELLPMIRSINPSADECIMDTARHIRQSIDVYADAVERARAQVCHMNDSNDGSDIDIQALLSLPSPQTILFEILSPYGFSDPQIEQVFNSLSAESGREFKAGDYIVYKDRDFLLLRKSEICQHSMEIVFKAEDGKIIDLPDGHRLEISIVPAGSAISRKPDVATFDAAKAGQQLQVRCWRQGDSFVPFGMKGRKLLSDFMTDLKLSVPDKRGQLVLTDGNDILWVIGRRTDNRYRVTDRTVSQLVIRLL